MAESDEGQARDKGRAAQIFNKTLAAIREGKSDDKSAGRARGEAPYGNPGRISYARPAGVFAGIQPLEESRDRTLHAPASGLPRLALHDITEAAPTLKPDLSNLAEIDLATFKDALAGPQREAIIRRTIDFLRGISERGTGIDIDRLRQPLTQSGPECQTMAILNGMQA
jgi:hypothetical protein